MPSALTRWLAADPDAKRRTLGDDLRRAVTADRSLDALAHPMLSPVEEQQHFELVIVLSWKGRYECDLADGRHSRCSPASGGVETPYRGIPPPVDLHIIQSSSNYRRQVWRAGNGATRPVDTLGMLFRK